MLFHQIFPDVFDHIPDVFILQSLFMGHHARALGPVSDLLRPAINAAAEIHLFGQEVNPETWAVSKSDLFMKDPTGRDADSVTYRARFRTIGMPAKPSTT